MPVKTSWPVVLAVVHPNIGGWIGGYITSRNISPWYKSLKKPSWTPPNWVFAPVWTTIYCSIGYSSYLVWRDGGGFEGAAVPLSIYGLNLALNWSWTPLFFGMKNIKLALYDIMLLLPNTVAMAITFYKVNSVAGCLIIPYMVWSTFATALNYVIYRDNKPAITDSQNGKAE